MKYFPVYLELRDRPCAVIGGGGVAERKALSLLEAGASVTVVSPSLTPKLRELSESGKINYLQKEYEEKDLSGEFLVIAATDSPEINTLVARACKKKHVLVNVAVPPGESSLIMPSLVERGELLIAISTSGASPALSRKIRQELEEKYGPEYEPYLNKLAAIRKRIVDEIHDEDRRKKVFQAIVDSNVFDLLKQGKMHEVEYRLAEIAGLKYRS